MTKALSDITPIPIDTTFNWPIDTTFNWNYEDHLIQGKMLAAQHIIGMAETLKFDSEDSFRQHVKRILAQQLAEKIIEDKLAEFTFEKIATTQSTVVRARCFITPDSNVAILRKEKKYE